MTDRVSAVIVNYNAREHLLGCIASLRAAGVHDIVVADNASVDGSEAAVRKADPAVTYVQTGANLGYGSGANRGAARAAAGTDYLLVTNPDVVVDPAAVKALEATLDARPELGLVGPRIDQPDGEVYPSARVFPKLGDAVGHAFLGLVWPGNRFTRRYRMLDRDVTQPADVDWISGSCFLARRAAWDQLSGFDEGYFMFGEDVDLCWRAWRAGWSVAFEPGATVVHIEGVSRDRHPYRMILEHHKGVLRFAAKTTTGPTRALLPVMAAGLAVRTVMAWTHRFVDGRRSKARARVR
ncbi:MAG TPA: glycosyltransferase family 2 protein [Acidimicrobiales bacterium]|nr:glycosyltransferase family 2 protein [Acidimicrobiales bacterium]